MISHDKLWHAVLSTLSTAFFGFFLGIPLAMGLTLAVGVIKEVSDYCTPGRHCEFMDIVADCIGIFIGAGGLYVLLQVFGMLL